jgi:hypothetical protein
MLQFRFGTCRSQNFEFQNHIYKYHKSACLIEMCIAEFFFSILWGWWTGEQPQEDLAKFGYRSEGKITIFETLNFLIPYIGDMQELMV